MTKSDLQNLSKRERQIMDLVVKLGQATVSDILANIPSPPSYDSIRVTMTILEKKGFLKHKAEGPRYVYSPVAQAESLQLSALEHLLSTLFQGSAQNMVSSLLNLPSRKLSQDELDELAELIEKAKREGD